MTDIRIGTASWLFTGPAKSFYPSGLKRGQELAHYSTVFSTVENNSAFYGPPTFRSITTWRESTPDDFLFSFKLYKKFTHEHGLRLTPLRERELREYLADCGAMGTKLGAFLIQLPATLPYNPKILQTFLRRLRASVEHLKITPDLAIEFRSADWFTEETYAVLRKFNIALVASHASAWPYQYIKTADILYFRLHGPKELYASAYSETKLIELRDAIRPYLDNVKRVYIYFNNTKNGDAAKDARRLGKLFAELD